MDRLSLAGIKAFCWLGMGGGVLGIAFGLQTGPAEFLQTTGRTSTEAPVPARGKLGQDVFFAVDRRDMDNLRVLLKEGADPNALNGLEIRPLFIAAGSFNMDAMQELIKAGAKPDATSIYGTPLTFACMAGNIAGVQILLSQGCDPNATARKDGISNLMMAANSGNPAIVDELLMHKADVTSKDDAGETALALAARNGSVDVGQKLLSAHADANASDNDGLTPLMQAAMNGHADFVKLLLANEASVNAKDATGRTALLLAVRYGDYPDVVQALTSGGADVNAKDEEGKTALQIAQARGYSGCVSALGGSMSEAPNPDARAALKAGLKKLEESMSQFSQSTTCVSCHHEGLGRITMGEASARGYTVDPQVQHVMLERVRGMVSAMKPLHQQALANPEVMKQLPLAEMNEISDTYGWLMAGMASENDPADDSTTAMARVLARQQASDGSWTFSLPRIPMQSSVYTFTALAVKALRHYAANDSDTAGRIERAKGWLLRAQPKTSEDRASRLLGLKWSGAEEADIKGAASAIIADQQKDGGWSQGPGLPTDAYATGEALYALHVADGLAASDPVYAKGVTFLVRTQDYDGTWYVCKHAIPANNYLDTGFPYGESQYASFNGTCWATLALMQALPTQKGSR